MLLHSSPCIIEHCIYFRNICFVVSSLLQISEIKMNIFLSALFTVDNYAKKILFLFYSIDYNKIVAVNKV